MTSAIARWLVALIFGLTALTGCEMPSSNAVDLSRVANDMLDMAEQTLPAIADDLGATLTKAVSGAIREGGSEGSTPRVTFRVSAWMDAPEPTQAALEQALIGTGFTNLIPQGEGLPSDVPSASAVSADGTTLVSLTYSAIINDGANMPYPALRISFSNVEPLRVSNGTFETFSRDFDREFDQSLAHEAPQVAALRQQADSMLDDTEAMLPALAEGLGATLTGANFYMTGEEAEPTTSSIVFTIEAQMTGPPIEQDSLERALVDAGYTNLDSGGNPNNLPAPYARAASSDGSVEISVVYATTVGPDVVVDVYLRSLETSTVANATLKSFKEAFTRDFDQNLVDSSSS